MTIARCEETNKDDTSILNLLKKRLVSANTSVQFLTEEIRIVKFCTEVFVMPKHLMTKLKATHPACKHNHRMRIFHFVRCFSL